jgi:hypothetical protein
MLHAGAFGFLITFMVFASIFYISKKQRKRGQQSLKQISAKTTRPLGSFSDLTIPKRYFNKDLKSQKPGSHEQIRTDRPLSPGRKTINQIRSKTNR